MKTRNQQKCNFKSIICLKVILIVVLAFSGKTNAQCGSALKFDTTNMSYIWGNSIPDITNNFTFEIWVKPSRSIREGINEVDKQYDGIFNQSYVVYGDDYAAETNATSAGLSVGTNGIIVVEGCEEYCPAVLVYYTSISTTEWTHIAVVYKDKRPSLYINGSFVKRGSVTPKSYVHPSPHLGDVSEGALYGPFGGSVDEYRIWDTALSAETIANWYKSVVTSKHPNYSDLYLYLPFDEGTGDSTADQSGNENPIFFEHHPEWVNGWQTNFTDAIPECNITTSTNSIFLGYGEQKSKLVASGGDFYKWEGSNLSSYHDDTTIFSPTEGDGYYKISLISKSNYGCMNKCDTSICVLDIKAPGGSTENPKIYICHSGRGSSSMPKTMAVNLNSIDEHISKHSDDKLGRCNQECSSTFGKKNITNYGELYTCADSKLLLYPNPSKGIFNFELESDSPNLLTIKIYDHTGKLLEEYNDGNALFTLNLKHLSKGVYIAEVSHDYFNKKLKLIIE